MRKTLVLLLTLSLCIGLSVAPLVVGSAPSVGWIDWTPGTPPSNNSITPDARIAWIDWTPGNPPSSNIITRDLGIAWIDWTPGQPPTANSITI